MANATTGAKQFHYILNAKNNGECIANRIERICDIRSITSDNVNRFENVVRNIKQSTQKSIQWLNMNPIRCECQFLSAICFEINQMNWIWYKHNINLYWFFSLIMNVLRCRRWCKVKRYSKHTKNIVSFSKKSDKTGS